jgi:broad specificity phosphatase PhoE
MTTLYLIRHGETDLNREGRFCGSTDKPLNDRGIRQVETLREPMSKIDLDRIYSSSLGRAIETAERVKNGRDIEIIPVDGLREIDCGEWETLRRDEIEARWPGEIKMWENTPDLLRMEGGELFADVRERVSRALLDIVSREHGHKIAITCHLMTIQMIMITIMQAPIRDIWKVVPTATNASITTVEIEDNGDFKVACWADDSHISADLKDSNQKVANMDDLLVGSKYNVLNAEEKHHFDGFAIK